MKTDNPSAPASPPLIKQHGVGQGASVDTGPDSGPHTAREPIISIRNIGMCFGSVTALEHISIDIQHGEIFALLGPSGCGKSTLLRVISGFENPTSGELLLDGKDVTRVPPNKRPINMVFQSYAVFPHMSVTDNVAYGLKMDKVPATEREQRVAEALGQVHLLDYGKRLPSQLSGGQRQRVALARALVKRPRVLLLDEPLSALDAKLRDAMRLELVKLQETVGITFVIVTHDQAEAMAMADRIAVLEGGRLRQVATPSEMYDRPADGFVADFIGTMHPFSITAMRREGDQVLLDTDALGALTLPVTALPVECPAIDTRDPEALPILAVRPESIRIALDAAPDDNLSVPGTLGDIAFQGMFSIVEIRRENAAALTAIVDNVQARALLEQAPGTAVHAWWQADTMHVLPKRAAPRVP